MQPYSALLIAGSVCTAGAGFSWGSLAPASQLFGPTIRQTGDPSVMAITFDDGPNPAVTPGLLDLLDRYHARATFFLIGAHVRAVPSLAAEIAARGHSIGNHTQTHPALTFLPSHRLDSELALCDDAIESATGKKPRWMRPPYGFRSPLLERVIRARGGQRVVTWSAMAWDWKPQPAAPVIRRLRRAHGGDIVVLHDGDHRWLGGDRHHTVAALAEWLPRWRDAGLRFVGLDELHAEPAAA